MTTINVAIVHSDVLPAGAQVRTRSDSGVAQARRALVLVTTLLLGLNAAMSVANGELTRATAADAVHAAVFGAEAPAASRPQVRLDTSSVAAGASTVVLRASADTTATITVFDGDTAVGHVSAEFQAGAPIRVPVTVAPADHDRNLAIRAEVGPGPARTLAVRVPAGQAVARAGGAASTVR